MHDEQALAHSSFSFLVSAVLSCGRSPMDPHPATYACYGQGNQSTSTLKGTSSSSVSTPSSLPSSISVNAADPFDTIPVPNQTKSDDDSEQQEILQDECYSQLGWPSRPSSCTCDPTSDLSPSGTLNLTSRCDRALKFAFNLALYADKQRADRGFRRYTCLLQWDQRTDTHR